MNGITILLIRDVNNKKPDDTIVITPVANNVLIKYKDTNTVNDVPMKDYIILENSYLSSYIKNVGYMFLTDTEPFESIQFNFPGFPAFLATRESLSNIDTQNTLVEIADLVRSAWFPSKKYVANNSLYTSAVEDPYESHY